MVQKFHFKAKNTNFKDFKNEEHFILKLFRPIVLSLNPFNRWDTTYFRFDKPKLVSQKLLDIRKIY